MQNQRNQGFDDFFRGVWSSRFNQNYDFGLEAESYLRKKFEYLINGRKFVMSRTSHHEHPYGAFVRAYCDEAICSGLASGDKLIDVGGSAIRTMTKDRVYRGAKRPRTETVHSMIPCIPGLDEIRHKEWVNKAHARGIGLGYNNIQIIMPNCCTEIATDNGLCKCVDEEGDFLVDSHNYKSIDTAYYPGVLQGIELELIKHPNNVAYLAFNDYASALRKGKFDYWTMDNEAHVVIKKGDYDYQNVGTDVVAVKEFWQVTSDVKGNFMGYQHRIVNTLPGSFQRKHPLYNMTIVYVRELAFDMKNHEYVLMSVYATQGKVNLPEVTEYFVPVAEEKSTISKLWDVSKVTVEIARGIFREGIVKLTNLNHDSKVIGTVKNLAFWLCEHNVDCNGVVYPTSLTYDEVTGHLNLELYVRQADGSFKTTPLEVNAEIFTKAMPVFMHRPELSVLGAEVRRFAKEYNEEIPKVVNDSVMAARFVAVRESIRMVVISNNAETDLMCQLIKDPKTRTDLTYSTSLKNKYQLYVRSVVGKYGWTALKWGVVICLITLLLITSPKPHKPNLRVAKISTKMWTKSNHTSMFAKAEDIDIDELWEIFVPSFDEDYIGPPILHIVETIFEAIKVLWNYDILGEDFVWTILDWGLWIIYQIFILFYYRIFIWYDVIYQYIQQPVNRTFIFIVVVLTNCVVLQLINLYRLILHKCNWKRRVKYILNILLVGMLTPILSGYIMLSFVITAHSWLNYMIAVITFILCFKVIMKILHKIAKTHILVALVMILMLGYYQGVEAADQINHYNTIDLPLALISLGLYNLQLQGEDIEYEEFVIEGPVPELEELNTGFMIDENDEMIIEPTEIVDSNFFERPEEDLAEFFLFTEPTQIIEQSRFDVNSKIYNIIKILVVSMINLPVVAAGKVVKTQVEWWWIVLIFVGLCLVISLHFWLKYRNVEEEIEEDINEMRTVQDAQRIIVKYAHTCCLTTLLQKIPCAAAKQPYIRSDLTVMFIILMIMLIYYCGKRVVRAILPTQDKLERKWLRSSCVTIPDRLDWFKTRGFYDTKFKFRNMLYDVQNCTGEYTILKLPCKAGNKILAGQVGPWLHGYKKMIPTVKHNCIRTNLAAVYRATGNLVMPEERKFDEFERFFDGFIDLIDGFVTESGGVVLDIDDWLKHYPLKYRENIKRSVKKMGDYKKGLYNTVQAFTKTELQISEVEEEYIDTELNTVKERCIFPPDDVKKLITGPIMWYLESVLSKYWKPYCGSKNWDEICKFLDYFIPLFKNLMGMEGDFSQYDSTNTVRMLKMFTKLIKKIVRNPLIVWKDPLNPELVVQAVKESEEIIIQILRGEIEARVPTRASGDTWTTLANTICSIIAWLFVGWKSGLNPYGDGYRKGYKPFVLLAKGDDVLGMLDEEVKRVLQENVALYFASNNKRQNHGLGLIVKMVHIQPIQYCTYLSNCFFRRRDGSLRMIRKPDRCFQTLPFTTKVTPDIKNYGRVSLEILWSKGMCLRSWASNLPIFDVIARKMIQLGKPTDIIYENEFSDPYRVFTDIRDSDYEDCVEWFYERFGLTREEINQIETAILHIKHPLEEVFLPQLDKLYY